MKLYFVCVFIMLLSLLAYTQSRASGEVYSGTGFFVQDQVILTARHVIVGHKEISVFYKGNWYPADVLAESSAKDLALLKVNTGSYTPYALIGTSYDKERATAEGYDLGVLVLRFHDIYFDRSVDQTGLNAVRTQDRICEGDSGGPIVDNNKEVIGVIDEGSAETKDFVASGCSSLGWVVTTDNISQFLISSGVIGNTQNSTINIVYITNQT